MKLKSSIVATSGHSSLFGISTGIITAFIMSLILVLGMTSLIMGSNLGENNTTVFLLIIRAVSVLLGVLIGTGLAKVKCIVIAGVVLIGYLTALTGIGIILYDGSFYGFGLSIISATTGAVAGCLIRLKLQNRPQRRKNIRV